MEIGVEEKIKATNAKHKLLTGTLCGHERDELVGDPVFRRFRPENLAGATAGTVHLICTSAGEVGIDISADQLVCDLNPLRQHGSAVRPGQPSGR